MSQKFKCIRRFSEIFTLPTLQKNFVNIFFVFAWEFCIEKWHPRNEERKVHEKFGKNSEQNSGQNSGRKFEKLGKLSFCNFTDLRDLPVHGTLASDAAITIAQCRPSKPITDSVPDPVSPSQSEILGRLSLLHWHKLALFRSLCDKRQLLRKNKFDKLSGIFPALVFVAF